MTCNMGDIPQSQWDELAEENQRLNQSSEWWEETCRIKTAEIRRLKALLTRAADALQERPIYDDLANRLIEELRKAAE